MAVEYWAISASKGSERDYSNIFFDYGIACLGGAKQKDDAKKVTVGDILILKKSCGEGGGFFIQAVGKVKTPFQENKNFDDVDGWRLDFVAEVEWHINGDGTRINGFRQGTIYAIKEPTPKRIADNIIQKIGRHNATKKPVDIEGINPVKENELLDFLIRRGLSVAYAQSLSSAIHRVERLATYYADVLDDENGDRSDPTEDETRSFLVLPLILALGWSEQRIRLEVKTKDRGEVDIALYKKAHRFDSNSNPHIIIEVKRITSGLDEAKNQAKKYFDTYRDCKHYLVTNGIAYRVYERDKNELTAYLNITQMLEKYRYNDKVKGATAVFEALLPPEYSD